MNINKCQTSPSFKGVFRINDKDTKLAEKGYKQPTSSFWTDNGSRYYISRDSSVDPGFMSHLNDNGIEFLYSSDLNIPKCLTTEEYCDSVTKNFAKRSAEAVMDFFA